MKRRQFCKGLVAAGVSSMFDGCLVPGGGDGYEVVILGDTHYDTEPADVYHAPIIPADTRSARWMFLGGGDEKTTAARRHFRRRLAERNAIVIGGHTHRLELMNWEGDGGRITQHLVNSVWSQPELATPQVLFDRPEQYGALQKQHIVRDDGKSAPDESALFDEYRPGMRRYYCAKAAGSCLLRIKEKSVAVSYYGGDAAAAVDWKLR